MPTTFCGFAASTKSSRHQTKLDEGRVPDLFDSRYTEFVQYLMQKFSRSILYMFFGFLMPMSVLVAIKNGAFRVHEIQIISSKPTEFLDYIGALQMRLQAYQGLNLWEVDLDRVEEIIKSETWIQDAHVYRHYPQSLRVEISPKQPVGLLLTKQGRMHMISADSTVMPTITVTRAPKLPVIQDARLLQNKNLRDKVVNVLRELPAEGRFSRETVGGVSISRDGDIVLEHLTLKTAIKLGDEGIAVKSARVARVLEYLEHNNLNSRVIDADFSKKVLVKLRNDR